MVPDEKFRIVWTGDGTPTLYSDEYDQTMHTVDGAYSEAMIKHVLPSKVLEKDEALICVLEVGFGIGYNILALLEAFLKDSSGRFLEVVTLEKNIDAISRLKCDFDDEKRQQLFGLIKSLPKKKEIEYERIHITLIEGDARRTVQTLEDGFFHAIFHDPFSPSKNPELWTVDFFGELYHIAHNGCVLTTYSSAPQIRVALLEAGFEVGKGPGMGKKREGTIAAKGSGIEILSDEERIILQSLKQSVPYRDSNLSSTRGEILLRRREEMRHFKPFGY